MIFKKPKDNLIDHLTEPQEPWGNRVVISAAGIIAGGWTIDNKVFLLSSDGYSISNPLTGEREIRNRDEENTAMSKFSKDNLEFTIDELKLKGQTDMILDDVVIVFRSANTLPENPISNLSLIHI